MMRRLLSCVEYTPEEWIVAKQCRAYDPAMRTFLLSSLFVLTACTPSSQGPATDVSSSSSSSSAASVAASSVASVVSADVYLGRGWEGKNRFINLRTRAEVTMIPDGYAIPMQHNYNQFPGFVILEKDGALFTFDFKNKAVTRIPSDLKVNENEQIFPYPSLSEDGKFFLMFNTYDPNEIGGMMPTAVASRSYFFDAVTNTLEESDLKEENLRSCYEYDSLHKRFLEWRCGEGVGSVLPVVEKDLRGVVKGDVFSPLEFDRSRDALDVKVDYANGLFFAAQDRIIIWDPKTNAKQTYVFTESIAQTLPEYLYAYSMTYDPGTKTIVVGQGDGVLLFRFDENRNIFASKRFPQDQLYANFIFVHDGKAYYAGGFSSKTINVLNLKTWEMEPAISTEQDEDITLVRG